MTKEAELFVEALLEEARGGNLPPPFVRALRTAEKAAAVQKKPARRVGRRPKTMKL